MYIGSLGQPGKVAAPTKVPSCGDTRSASSRSRYNLDENILASASDDTTVVLWRLKNDSPEEADSDARVVLSGHDRGVRCTMWHPSVRLHIHNVNRWHSANMVPDGEEALSI